ncbi:MAG: SGNH/GDSL hydrolase family protein [Candidatus Binatia bacterium]
MAGRGARIAAIGMLLGGGLLVGLLLAEVLVRLVAPQPLYRYPRGLFVDDAAAGYRLTPGFQGTMRTIEYTVPLAINGAGLREDREVGPKANGLRRVLIVGDSFAMGHSVRSEDTFEHRLERAINASSTQPVVEVLNAGVPGYSTRDELAWMTAYGAALDPDLVVLAFFVGNDVADNAKSDRRLRVVDGFLSDGEPVAGLLPIGLRSVLARTSHLYALAWPIQRRLRGGGDADRIAPLAIYQATAEDGPMWGPTRDLVTDFVRAVRGRGTAVAVAIFPELIQVEPGRWERVAGTRTDLDRLAPNRRVARLTAELGVPTIDVEPALSAAAGREPLYFEVDHHWTVAGNRVAAEALRPLMEAR